MGRWEPDARSRLERSAMELYGERGFEQTTVAEIANRAGLAERTFYRHFADKREVLFGGSAFLFDALTASIAAAPQHASPLEAVAAALETAGTMFEDRLELARYRQAIISAHVELRERELIKFASLASAFAAALRRRGVDGLAADLAAEAGVSIFKIGFARWVDAKNENSLRAIMREALAEFKAVAAAR